MRRYIPARVFDLGLPGEVRVLALLPPFLWQRWEYMGSTDTILWDLGRGLVTIHDDAPDAMREAFNAALERRMR